jgi:Phage P22-like portal protein
MMNDIETDPSAGSDANDTSTADGLLLTAKAWFRSDREHSADWRDQAKEDFDFVAGHQWSEEDKLILKEQLRPEITFNRIAPTVESVVGIEIGNRREVRYIPRSAGDEKADEVLTAAGQWAREQCDAEDEESDAFFDVIVCGMGWVDTRMDYEEDPDGKIREERIDPLEMLWDASARKRNLADARRTWRIKTMPIEDAGLLAPDADDEDLDAAWARTEDRREPHNADPQVAYRQDIGTEDRRASDDVTVVHLQWWERENYYRVAFNGRIESVAEDDFPTFRKRADKLTEAGLYLGPPMQAVRQIRKVYKQALIGAKVLSFGPGPCEGHFSWECITGKRDHNKGTFYGLVRAMKDPQRWANKWLSQSLHILNSNAKGGIFAERGAFENDRDAEDSYARADRITWLKSGALAAGRIQPKSPPAIPQSLGDLLQYAISSIRDVSGVNVELLGMREADQPASLEESRKQSGMAILASLFDSLRRYRKRQGRILLYFIMTYLSDGRLIRIVGQEGAQYVPLIHQAGLVEYDVIVDDEATSPNQKEKVWATLMQMMPMLCSARPMPMRRCRSRRVPRLPPARRSSGPLRRGPPATPSRSMPCRQARATNSPASHRRGRTSPGRAGATMGWQPTNIGASGNSARR